MKNDFVLKLKYAPTASFAYLTIKVEAVEFMIIINLTMRSIKL
uniref:Uncharacterized protein n=1 Tax=Arundo donax TaxID=35708 RepID=A0A0A9HJS4_ARUDO